MLCIGGAFVPFYTMYQNVALSNGRSDIYMRCNVIQIILQLAIIAFCYRLGINAMIMFYTLFTIAWLLVWQYAAHRIIGIRLWEVIKDVVPTMFVAAGVMILTYFATAFISSLLLLLLTRIVVATLLYIGVTKMLHMEILEEAIIWLKKKRK